MIIKTSVIEVAKPYRNLSNCTTSVIAIQNVFLNVCNLLNISDKRPIEVIEVAYMNILSQLDNSIFWVIHKEAKVIKSGQIFLGKKCKCHHKRDVRI